jgi:hypothetical protein
MINTPFEPGSYEQNFVDCSIQLLLPVMENSMLVAAQYSKATGRTFITSVDMKYSLRYCAQHVLGKSHGSLFPEIYEESESDSDEDEVEIVQEDEDSFTRYEGDDELCNKVNEAYDMWDQWEPRSPAEKMLKDAVDKQN